MTTQFITPDLLLLHWQGHRRLTRRTIELFPSDKLFSYSIGGMRPFAELAMEMVRMAAPGLQAVIDNKWQTWEELKVTYPLPHSREDLMHLWDESSVKINSLWAQLPPARFADKITSLAGQYEGPEIEDTVLGSILYLIDNENHHRAQGYVYLRSLGIEPPHFWKRD